MSAGGKRSAPENLKLTYTSFPKDWTPERIYEYLIAWAEEDEKTRDDVSDGTTKGKERSSPLAVDG